MTLVFGFEGDEMIGCRSLPIIPCFEDTSLVEFGLNNQNQGKLLENKPLCVWINFKIVYNEMIFGP